MNKLRILSALLLVSVALFAIGCGGGGATSVTVEKDVAGITRTLGDFMAAARAGDQAKLQSLMASSGEYYLIVKDFGTDITDPDDNQSYEFYVNPDLISQPSADVAYVYAYYRLYSGETLWLYFNMVKESGRWVIEEMASKAPEAGGYVNPTPSATEFIVALYQPINSDIKSISSVVNSAGTVSPFRQVSSYVDKATVGDITFYKRLKVNVAPASPMYAGFSTDAGARRAGLHSGRFSIRTATTGLGTTTGGEVAEPEVDLHYGFDSKKALWFKKTSSDASFIFNNSQPIKLLEPSHPFGSKRVVKYSYVNNGETHYRTRTIDIGYPITTGFATPLKTYNSVVALSVSDVDDNDESGIEKWIEYYALGVGEVGFDDLDRLTSTLVEKNRLLTRFNGDGSLNERNDPIITNTNTNLGSYNVGDTITSMQVTASGGNEPLNFRWFSGASGPEALITGIVVSSGGLLTGHIGGGAVAGTFSGNVEVVDKYNRHASKKFTVTVAASAGGVISFSPTLAVNIVQDNTIDSWIMIEETSVQKDDYSFDIPEFKPSGEEYSYISFVKDGTGFAKIEVYGLNAGATINFRIRATRNADGTVYMSSPQTIAVGLAASLR